MTLRSSRLLRLLAVALAMTLVLAACGGDDDETTSGSDTEDAGGELSGSITIDGSSTVAPITEAIAEEFRAEQGDIDVTVGTSGTGGGFTKFCAGETQISNASRTIKDEEKAACQAKGVEYEEFRIGLDGLAVVTSAENDFVECLSFEQLAGIFKEGGASTWNQVDPKFPNAKIDIFAPGTDSGTYDFFIEEILGDPEEGGMKARSDYTASEDDNVLVQGISGEANSWGFFGFAYFQENESTLKDIKVGEEKGTCVEPTAETVESGDYPLSRPLYIYVAKTALEEPHVSAFVRFYLETTPEIVGDVGYVAAPEEDYTKGLEILETYAG